MSLTSTSRFGGYAIALAFSAMALLTLYSDAAMAQWFQGGSADDTILREGGSRLYTIWEFSKQGVYIVGGLGLLLMGVFAFFGKFRWPHFLSLAGGMLLVAFVDQVVDFLGGNSSVLN